MLTTLALVHAMAAPHLLHKPHHSTMPTTRSQTPPSYPPTHSSVKIRRRSPPPPLASPPAPLAARARCAAAAAVIAANYDVQKKFDNVPFASSAAKQFSELSCALLFPDQFAAVRSWHHQRARDAGVVLEAAEAELEYALASLLPVGSYSVESRVKSALSLFDKVFMRGKVVTDVLALRIVLDDAALGSAADPECLETCGDVAKTVGRLWESKAARDYIRAPKANGYQSVHMHVRLPSGVPLEVQIRTRTMHERAEHGSASHVAYKLDAARTVAFA